MKKGRCGPFVALTGKRLITQLGVIHRFDESGHVIWEIDMQGRSFAPGAMIDLDSDGKLEYAFCTQDGFLQVLNNAGEFLYRYHFRNRTINVTPTFGDVSAASPGLEMLITGWESSLLFCLGTPAATNAIADWKSYRGDARNHSSWFGLRQSITIQMSPANLNANEILTAQSLRFAIHNAKPGAHPLTATAVCVRPDGGRQMATTTVLGKQAELQMPIEVIAPGNYSVNWTLAEADGRTLASGERSVFLQPFANARALVPRALTALRAAADATEP